MSISYRGLLAQLKLHGGLVMLYVVLSASLALNVLLGLKLNTPPVPQSYGIAGGSQLSAIPISGTDGVDGVISFEDARPTVLYVMSPTCKWCAKNEANIAALAKAKGSAYRFIALSNTPTGLAEYVESRHLTFEAVAVNAKRIISAADLQLAKDIGVTPQTVVVTRGGRVEKSWAGAFNNQIQADVEKFFGVSLPGLVDVP